jgi:hypothetical protein
MHPQSKHYFVTAWTDSGATFVRCHAIETDFANQTTAAAIVTVPASKPTKAIAGSSTNAIVLLRDKSASRNTKCLLRARRAIGGNQGKMVAHAVTREPVSTGKFPANRENNREFCKIAAFEAAEALNNAVLTSLPRRIP